MVLLKDVNKEYLLNFTAVFAAAFSHHYDLACGILQSLAQLLSVAFFYFAPRGDE